MVESLQQLRTIFVVEDDAQISALLTDFLEEEGYQVRTGSSSTSLPTVLQEPPDLILLDVMMPGLDGIEFCRQVKANPVTAHVPVIFITAAATESIAPRLQTIHYEQLLRKPFALSQLLGVVRQYLDQ